MGRISSAIPVPFSRREVLSGATAVAGLGRGAALAQPSQDIWQFNRLDNIGGNPARVDGEPKISSSQRKGRREEE